jgi:hypothetical protein
VPAGPAAELRHGDDAGLREARDEPGPLGEPGGARHVGNLLVRQVVVRHEVVGVRAFEDDDLHLLVGLDAVHQHVQGREHPRVVEVDGRIVDGHAPVARVDLVDAESFTDGGHLTYSF